MRKSGGAPASALNLIIALIRYTHRAAQRKMAVVDVQFASRYGTNDWVQLAPSSGLMM